MLDASGQSIFKNDRKEFEEKMGRFKGLINLRNGLASGRFYEQKLPNLHCFEGY